MKQTICDRCGAKCDIKDEPFVIAEIFIDKQGDYCPKCTEDLTSKIAKMFSEKIMPYDDERRPWWPLPKIQLKIPLPKDFENLTEKSNDDPVEDLFAARDGLEEYIEENFEDLDIHDDTIILDRTDCEWSIDLFAKTCVDKEIYHITYMDRYIIKVAGERIHQNDNSKYSLIDYYDDEENRDILYIFDRTKRICPAEVRYMYP